MFGGISSNQTPVSRDCARSSHWREVLQAVTGRIKNRRSFIFVLAYGCII